MTNEEKARAYDEALKRAKAAIDVAADKDLVGGVIRTILPELTESEDERIRKVIVDMVKRETGFTGFPSQGQILAYLEKQKDSNDMTFHEGYTIGFDDGVKSVEQKEPHYTKRNALFDKCVENCDPTIMKNVFDEVDEMLEKEQKEQKPEPVFKVGDKIKLKSEPKYPYREIVDIRNGAYYFDEAVYLPFDNQDNWEKEQKHILKFKVGDKVHLEGDNINILTITGIEEDRYLTDNSYGPILFEAEDIWEIVEQKSWKVGANAYFTPEQNPTEFTHHEVGESLVEVVDHQMEDDGDVDDFVRRGIDDIVLKYAELGAKWQKEQKPTNYDEYCMLIDGAREEGKIAGRKEVLDNPKEYGLQKEQKSAEIDEYEIIKKHITEDVISSEVNKRLKECGWYVTEKPAEWNATDKAFIKNCVRILDENGYAASAERLLSMFPIKPVEWNEEDEHRRKDAIYFLESAMKHYADTSEIEKTIAWLKSLRPQPYWKPSEEQMKAFDEAMNYIPEFYKPKSNLASLLRDLKKLM